MHKKNMKHHLILFYICISSSLLGMENPHQVVIIPGQNELGGDNFYEKRVKKSFMTYITQTPAFPWIDFGQKHCVTDAQKTLTPLLNTLDKSASIIVHGTSQGTATAAKIASLDTEKKIKVLFLESIMLSGNSAIVYNVFGASHKAWQYYVLPYLARLIYPCYSPAGDNIIDVYDKIDKELPIIIAHATQDACLSYNDAAALYSYLKQKNHNVYFISKIGRSHVNLCSDRTLEDIANNYADKEKLSDIIDTLNHDEPFIIQKTHLEYFELIENREKNIKKYHFLLSAIPYLTIASILFVCKAILQLSYNGQH